MAKQHPEWDDSELRQVREGVAQSCRWMTAAGSWKLSPAGKSVTHLPGYWLEFCRWNAHPSETVKEIVRDASGYGRALKNLPRRKQ